MALADTDHIKVHKRICPFCEQNCATLVEADHASGKVLSVRGDKEDPLSKGFVCPKSVAVKDLHHDPDRLRGPVIKRDGKFVGVGWDEALDFVAERLQSVSAQHGASSLGFYAGTSLGHVQGIALYSTTLLTVLQTPQIFTSSSVDCHPHFLVSASMFGALSSLPVPDVDNCDYLVVIGANPSQSNGSFLTAPNLPGRLRAIRARGGKLVVIDPRRTETADIADWHLPVKPSGDAPMLLAVVRTLFEENLVNLRHIENFAEKIDRVRELSEPFLPERVSQACGIDADDIRKLAREIAGAERACVYGRLGSSAQTFGTLTNWLINVINALTGNLDRVGGVLFPDGPIDPVIFSQRYANGQFPFGRWHSRVRGFPEMAGQFPAPLMLEEMVTEGEGQIKALITMGANPVLSNANGGRRLGEALGNLEFMVSFDIYINETTRHADVILPSPSQLSHSDFMLFYAMFAVREYIKYVDPVFELGPNERHDSEMICEIVSRLTGQTPAEADEATLKIVFEQLRGDNQPVLSRMTFEKLVEQLGHQEGPDRIFDMLVRAGKYGDHFGERPDGLTLAMLKENGQAIDFGPMEPRIADVIHLPGGKIDFAPEVVVADLPRLEEWIASDSQRGLQMIGRRQVRSCNSWMHDFPSLAKGPELCVLLMHPEDARERGVSDGEKVSLSSAQGSLQVPVKISDEMRRGVVSLPHGWGHDDDEVPGRPRAKARAGVNYNILVDETVIDEPSGNANFNSVPVEVHPC